MKKDFILNTQLLEQQTALFYLGQESYLIKHSDKYILIDPYLSDYVDQNCCTETVKWVRKYSAPIKASELDFVDYVLCTHAHYDHMDPYTLKDIADNSPDAIFIAPEPIKNNLLNYGIAADRIVGAIADEPLELEGCRVIPVPSAHEKLHKNENGYYMELGYKILLDNLSIYHAGDCCVYDGLAEHLMNIDVLMVPVNGRSYYKLRDDIIGNMTAEEAVLLAKETNARLLIPMHYDLYDVNCINPAHFVDRLFTIHPTQAFHMFIPGEKYIIDAES